MDYQQYLQNHVSLQQLGYITERVFPFPEVVLDNSTILDYINDDNRYIIVTSGRQSFKSEIAKRKVLVHALQHGNQRILIGMPTQAQVKRIYYDGPLNLPDMFPQRFIKKIRDSEMRVELVNGTQIELFSAETVQRVEGSYAHLVILDECGDMNIKEVWQRSIAPMTVPTKGKIYFLGVPRQNMSGEYKEIWQEYSDKVKHPEWSTYTWPAEAVLDGEEIARIKAQVDPLLYEQEFMGKFHEGIGGKAFHQFNKELHVKDIKFNDFYPLFVTCDFNTSVMHWEICQTMPDGMFHVLDEVSSHNTNVFKQVPLLQQRIVEMCNGDEVLAKNRGVLMYGDYSGNNGTVTSKGSVWSEIKHIMLTDGWKVDIRTKPNPVVDKRISAANARLRSADGKMHVTISPKAKNLIRDLDLVSWSDLMRNKDKLEKQELTHAADGWSYALWYHWPLVYNVYN